MLTPSDTAKSSFASYTNPSYTSKGWILQVHSIYSYINEDDSVDNESEDDKNMNILVEKAVTNIINNLRDDLQALYLPDLEKNKNKFLNLPDNTIGKKDVFHGDKDDRNDSSDIDLNGDTATLSSTNIDREVSDIDETGGNNKKANIDDEPVKAKLATTRSAAALSAALASSKSSSPSIPPPSKPSPTTSFPPPITPTTDSAVKAIKDPTERDLKKAFDSLQNADKVLESSKKSKYKNDGNFIDIKEENFQVILDI